MFLGIENIVGSGTTGAVVVAGLVVYEIVKAQVAKRNGGVSVIGFTQQDRDMITCQKRYQVEIAEAMEQVAQTMDKMHDLIVRIDERDKTRTRQQGGIT